MQRSRRALYRSGESGTAIVLALLFTIVIAGITTTGVLLLQAHRQATRTDYLVKTQALQTARSGLTEATSWLRRQTSQPVLAFAPVSNPAATPPVLDTMDPDIGLVREFPINDRFWARDEVWKAWPADPQPARAAMRALYRCEDVSLLRGANSSGSIWRLRSVGYVFSRIDESVPFDRLPNTVLAQDVVETEVRRLVLNLPGQAALNVADGNSCHINTNGRILGGAMAGVYYPSGTGTPTTGPAAANRVTGTPGLSTAASYDDSYEAVFGIGYAELRAMANLVVTDPNDFPVPAPQNSIVVVETSAMHWTSARPLLGSGLVIVSGNAQISDGSNSNFSGLLYVDGNLTVRGPSEIRGSVICTGNVTVQGVPDFATLQYDEDALQNLMSAFGSYNRSHTLFRTWSTEH